MRIVISGLTMSSSRGNGHATLWRSLCGALTLRGAELAALHGLHVERDHQDAYLGTLINAHLQRGGVAWGARAGESYVDVGTFDGYREALRLLQGKAA